MSTKILQNLFKIRQEPNNIPKDDNDYDIGCGKNAPTFAVMTQHEMCSEIAILP